MQSRTLKVRALVPGLNQRGRDIPVDAIFEAPSVVAETLLARKHVEIAPERPAKPTRRAPKPDDRPKSLSEQTFEAPRRQPTLSDPNPD